MIDDPELGLTKQCAKCKEWWPADTEFFDKASSRKDGLHPYCHACAHAARYPNGRGQFQVPIHSPWELVVGYVESV